MKLLNGAEIAGFIKERQAKAVRGLIQAHNIQPRLAIIRTNSDPVVDTYMRLKISYGQDIGAAVDVHTVEQKDASRLIKQLNDDEAVHGIIVQLPLPDKSQTDEILDMVSSRKDVDGLAKTTNFDAATPTAINWLLSGYGIELKGKEIVVVGQGRLVGKPLYKMLKSSGLAVQAVDKDTADIDMIVSRADVIISATGRPGSITEHMVKQGAIVVDAGTSTDANGQVGDVEPSIRQRDDVTITPETGGVGPLTVAALFENVITAAQNAKS